MSDRSRDGSAARRADSRPRSARSIASGASSILTGALCSGPRFARSPTAWRRWQSRGRSNGSSTMFSTTSRSALRFPGSISSSQASDQYPRRRGGHDSGHGSAAERSLLLPADPDLADCPGGRRQGAAPALLAPPATVVSFHNRNRTGDLLTRGTGDVTALRRSCLHLLYLATEGGILAGVIVMMFLLEWRLALVAVLVLPAILFFSAVYSGRIRAATQSTKREGQMAGRLHEAIAGINRADVRPRGRGGRAAAAA